MTNKSVMTFISVNKIYGCLSGRHYEIQEAINITVFHLLRRRPSNTDCHFDSTASCVKTTLALPTKKTRMPLGTPIILK